MKMIAVLMSIMFLSQAQASNTVFQCSSSVEIDPNSYASIGISVMSQGSAFSSVLAGSADDTLVWETAKQVVPFTDSLKIVGVKDILKATNLKSADYNKIANVEVYTAGNFEDDLAGVRTAQFFDQNGLALASGMFFGWAGAVRCK